MERRDILRYLALFSSFGYFGCGKETPEPTERSMSLSERVRQQRERRRDRLRDFLGLGETETPENLDRLVDYNAKIGPYLNSIEEAIDRNSLEGKIDPLLMLSIVKTESNFDEYAVSPLGAGGPFQIMPDTGDIYGLIIYDLGQYITALSTSREGLVENYVSELSEVVSGKTQIQLNGIDQRFVINLAANAAVRIFSDNLDQTPNLDRAIAAYYTGATNANKSSLTSDVRRYVRDVKGHREDFLEQLK